MRVPGSIIAQAKCSAHVSLECRSKSCFGKWYDIFIIVYYITKDRPA